MSLIDYIRPKWKHSNWEIRRAAVMELLDINDLRSVAQNDKHHLVREEALRKLNDPIFLAEVAQRRRSLLLACLICVVIFIVLKNLGTPRDSEGQQQPPIPNLSLDFIDNILSNMQFGNIAFNAPSTLRLGDETIIELLLSCESTINELKQRLSAAGEKEGYRIRIANDMQACLWGRGFQCKAIMPQEQVVSTAQTTYWKWDVQAIKGGNQTLHLTLSTNIYINQHAAQYAIKTFERKIIVQVTWRKQLASFIRSYWQWIFTVMLIPTIAWSTNKWTRMRLRSKSNAAKSSRIILDNWKDNRPK